MTTAAIQLMKHQREGVDFLVGGRSGLLAFEQGLGKTLVAIEAFRQVVRAGAADRLLVICPNSLKKNWVAEITKFAPELNVLIIEGPPRERRKLIFEADATIVIMSYETARVEVPAVIAMLKRFQSVLALDESHTAKTWRSLTSIATRHFAPLCRFRWLLSGTPVTNSAADLFTQIEIIAPDEQRLGNIDAFLALAANDPSAAADRAAPLVLRRTKDQCLDLPKKTFIDLPVELPGWQRKLYDEMRDNMVCELRSMSGQAYRSFAPSALARITRLMQIASNPALVFPEAPGNPGKFAALDSLVADILGTPGRKLIIWSNYIKSIETLLDRFADRGAVALYGGTPVHDRQTIAEKFQSDPEVRVLIGNPAAAGTGFTLTAASFSIYETLSWRFDYYAQSQDRNHRIGQSLPVTYTRLIAAGTVEEAIAEALARKSDMASELLGDQRSNLSIARLSREEMTRLIEFNELPK